MADSEQYQKIVPFIGFALALLLTFLLVRPMIGVLLGSFLLAYISFPLYKRIAKRIPNRTFSIILSLSLVVIIILTPISFMAFGIIQQGYLFYNSLSSNIEKGALLGFGCASEDSQVCLLVNQAETFSLEQLSKFGLDKEVQQLFPVIEEKIGRLISGIPIMIAQIFLALIISYFILKDWKGILANIVDLLPVRKRTIDRLIKEFANTAHTVVYAQLFIALVQGIIGIIGFYIFGVPFPIFLGVLLAFFALIPTIGTAIIWMPASIYLILTGYFSGDHMILAKGIGLFLYGLLIISTIDNILLAKIVHAKAKVSQILVIIGVIGGASLFGFVGIFIGPILLPLLMTYFQTFKERFS